MSKKRTRTKKLILPRRRFLQGGLASLALPSLSSSVAHAQMTTPKRMIVFHYPQGTVMNQYVPSGTERDFSLPFILKPLEDWKEKLLILNGVDNLTPLLNQVGTQHWNSNLTFLTAQPFLQQDESLLLAGGPSIEQVVASRISQQTPYPRLDFTVGGLQNESGIWTPTGPTMWYDKGEPIGTFNHVQRAIEYIFGDQNEDALFSSDEKAYVLDKVLLNFDSLSKKLSGDDRILMESHTERIERLQYQILNRPACESPLFSYPAGYDPSQDDLFSVEAFSDLLVTSLACGYTNVATLGFANGRGFGFEDHPFPWLWEENGGNPIVDYQKYDTWHAMAHADYEPGMELVYRWYIDVFADLLTKLSNTTDTDGDNLLDTTLILCISEFSSGRHWNSNLPIILAGNCGGIEMGRWVNKMNLTPDDFHDDGAHAYTGFHISQLYVSILQAFGFEDQSFGYDGRLQSSKTDIDRIPQGSLFSII